MIRRQSGRYHHERLLTTWLTLEVLSPQTMPSVEELRAANRVAVPLRSGEEPWKGRAFAAKGKEHGVFWIVYIGQLDLHRAVEALLTRFPDSEKDERTYATGACPISAVVLDATGRPVRGKTYISSFAWGYGKVLAGDLADLATFTEAEEALRAEIDERLTSESAHGSLEPIRTQTFERLLAWLIKEFNLPPDHVKDLAIAVRVPVFNAYSDAPEPDLLNSFFLEDLRRVRAAAHTGKLGKACSSFISSRRPATNRDVVRDRSALEETLAPARMPLSRWPGPGRHPLYLMQQAAINHAAVELSHEGMVGINGPPGTGKTTLLRDVVAHVVLERARALAGYENPADAFTYVAHISMGAGRCPVHRIDHTLLGFEIVVASSNNTAVENISREVPSAGAIDQSAAAPPRYFSSISDAIAAGKTEVKEGATWGLAAAVLGNASNRAAFAEAFWWDKQRGMAAYLWAIGDADQRALRGARSGKTHVPEVVQLETPPQNPAEALARWRAARARFRSAHSTAQRLVSEIDSVYLALRDREQAVRDERDARDRSAEARGSLLVAQLVERSTRRDADESASAERNAEAELAAVTSAAPSCLARTFKRKAYTNWLAQYREKKAAYRAARVAASRAKALRKSALSRVASAHSAAQRAAEVASLADATLATIEAEIARGRNLLGERLPDEAFWLQDEERIQLASPWMFDALQRAREELFRESFALHRAFIDAAAVPLRDNVRAALDVMKGRSLSDTEEAIRGSLWASLFLMIPVVSTTFASVSRLFGPLGPASLGWLLVDEAGQAAPQAAIGALWRAKRAIVIGDPLQLEPVVTIPPRLVRAICSTFQVAADEWAAPRASVQSLADRASWFGTMISGANGDMWVGSPLRVHRRCAEPMFSISNAIAYDGLMVFGTPPKHSPIGDVLGPSRWIDVPNAGSGKWMPEEGVIAVALLNSLRVSGILNPDLFFITPFRIVSSSLRSQLRAGFPPAAHPSSQWVDRRAGTIHTFQGREAEAVVLVLGASSCDSARARQWAGEFPNLLNVAVTRAKLRLYVIGDYRAWENQGYFRYLARSIPLAEPQE